MKKAFEKQPNRYKLTAVVLLVSVAIFLTYYFHVILGSGKIFTHFFYVPIFLSALWWKRKGLIVAVLLALLLVLSHDHLRGAVNPNDYVRALMFIGVGYVVALLSEKLEWSEKAVRASKEIYETIFETTGTATVIVEADTTISLANRQFENLSGYPKEAVEGKKKWTEFFSEEDLDRMMNYHHIRRVDPNAVPRSYSARFMDREGNSRDVILNVALIPGTKKSVTSLSDITAIKDGERAREDLQKRLEEALAHVLSGFIPICANCKKIRDDKGEWSQVETYIRDRSKAEFSHTICPECGKELYGDLYRDGS